MDVKTLKNDLLKDYKYHTELHAHTSPASSWSEIAPEDVVAIYKNLGYDAVTIANHFTYEYQNSDKQTVIDRFFGDFERAKKKVTAKSLASEHQEELRQLYFVAEQYMGKPLSVTEIQKINYFFDQLNFSTDLIESLSS
jgi:DNA replication protein DnaD